MLERLSGVAARRPAVTVAILVALALGGGLLALGLRPSAGLDTFVSRSSATYRTTADDERRFGDDAVVILVREPLTRLLSSGDLASVTRLEACLAGEYAAWSPALEAITPVAAGSHAPYGGWASPCGELMRSHAAKVVYGPGTFLNRAVAAINLQLRSTLKSVASTVRAAEVGAYRLALNHGLSARRARADASAAGQLEYGQQLQALARLYLGSGISGAPSIDNHHFISQIVFDPTRGLDQPKARFAYLFPTAGSALIQVRLKASLSDAAQARAISLIRAAVRMPQFQSPGGATFTVTGVPVVVDDLAARITGSIGGLLIAAVLVMALVLAFAFRGPVRLAPLALALVAAGITFGLLATFGATLTMASIAVLPILIGLAVDYGIQFQARVNEERAAAAGAALAGDVVAGPATAGRASLATRLAVARAAGRAAPTIATAALATATGFLVLLLSPVPMVRGFGLLLVAGIAVALVCALTGGSAVLVLAGSGGGPFGASLRGAVAILRPPLRAAGEIAGRALRGARGIVEPSVRGARGIVEPSVRGARGIVEPSVRGARGIVEPSVRGARGLVAPSVRGAGEIVGGGRTLLGAARARIAAGLLHRPERVIAVAAVLAVAGWVADTGTRVQSDVTKLVPSNMPALRDLRTLERVTGVSGEIDVTVRGTDVATPAAVRWMTGYEDELLRHYGYSEQRGCSRSTLCPALSLPDLFSPTGTGQTASAGATGQPSTLTGQQIDSLLAAVPSYFSAAVITPDHRQATLAFGIRLMPLARQQRVIEYMRSRLRPPPGVTAALAGIPVLAAQANAALSSAGHRLLTLVVGLLAVGLVLLAVLRRPARALVPMVPIVLATGWSSLILFATGIPLNPMSATLGTLVIAISTEFSVLLSERCRQERAAGHDLATALARTYRSTGAAVVVSGITAIAGFGVLVFSDITMLRDFGFVTVLDLSVSLVGVLLVLPAALALSEPRVAVALDSSHAPSAALA